MRDIQFYHANKSYYKRATFYVKMPNRVILESIPINGDLNIKVGVALVHPKDNYNKATGRSIATLRSQYINFQPSSLKKLHDCYLIKMYGRTFIDDKEMMIELEFKLGINKKSSRLVGATVWDI